ncbi:polysaccharide deacetylase family protein [bacterium]|nr:polysaccharide deacetylase family protein [bacterium]MBU1675348.1 polysaccharide deacetylase family protein [bacterium]
MAPASLKERLTSPFVTRRLPVGDDRRVLLTFDDGPTPGVTDGVLARLEDHGAHAIFFVVGRRIERDASLLPDVLASGHALGNHSTLHDDARLPSPVAYHRDVRLCRDLIARASGAPPPFFRAPAGRLHPASLLAPLVLGMKHVLWSLDSRDWRCRDDDDARAVAREVLDTVSDRDIILLHDYAGYIHALLDVLLPGLAAAGYDLGTGLSALGTGRAPRS